MPLDVLQTLAGDVNRLLSAGSAAAVGDDGLTRGARALRTLANKVPALNRVADAVARVTAAAPGKASPPLLDLLLVVRQVRASLADGGPTGASAPVEPSGPWACPIPAADLYPLLAPLLDAVPKRPTDLTKRLTQQPAQADLRTVGPLLITLENGWTDDPRNGLVCTQVLPLFGPGLAPDLERHLNLEGSSTDARRLAVLCHLDPRRGLEHCRAALEKGSAPVQAAALRALARIAPAEAEPIAMQVLQRKKIGDELRNAAYTALGSSGTDEALERLLTAVDDPKHQWPGAAEGLAASPHPQATARLVERFQYRVRQSIRLENLVHKAWKSRSRSKTIQKERQEARALANQAGSLARRMAWVVGARGDAVCLAALAAAARHRSWNIAGIGSHGIMYTPTHAVALVPDLVKLLQDKSPNVRVLAANGLARVGLAAPSDVVPALAAALQDNSPHVRNMVAAALATLGPTSAPATTVLVEALQKHNDSVRVQLIRTLAAIGPAAQEAVPTLTRLANVPPKRKSYTSVQAAIALNKILGR